MEVAKHLILNCCERLWISALRSPNALSRSSSDTLQRGEELLAGAQHLLLCLLRREVAYQVHFMYEDEDAGVGAVLLHGLQDAVEERYIVLQITGVNIEHVDEHLHVPRRV